MGRIELAGRSPWLIGIAGYFFSGGILHGQARELPFPGRRNDEGSFALQHDGDSEMDMAGFVHIGNAPIIQDGGKTGLVRGWRPGGGRQGASKAAKARMRGKTI